MNSIHTEDRERVIRAFNDYISAGGPEYDVEYRMMTRWGYHWFHDCGHCMPRISPPTGKRLTG